MVDLKREQSELEKIIKTTIDYRFVLNDYLGKRAKKITMCRVLEKTTPPSRYELNDILPEDVEKADEYLASEREKLITAASGLRSEEAEIQKIISKKEALLKEGKCPTCGQEIKADSLHSEHKTDEELKRLADIKNRYKAAVSEKGFLDEQMKIVKEILEVDRNIGIIKIEISKSESEENGKKELIAGYLTGLKENEERKRQKTAHQLDLTIMCDARGKDLENISRRLVVLNAEKSEKAKKMESLAECKKEFSNTANMILRHYTTLENEKKNKKETQKRLEESAAAEQKILKTLEDLKNDIQTILALEEKTKADEMTALGKVTAAQSILSKAENLSNLKTAKDGLKKSNLEKGDALKLRGNNLDILNNQIAEKIQQMKIFEAKISTSPGDKSFEEQKSSILSITDSLNADIHRFENKKTEVTQEIGKLENEIGLFKQYENESSVLRNKILFISLVMEDVSTLEDMYIRIRADMRSKNIEMLDRLLNDMFDFIYTNNAYSHLELDADYNLKVHKGDFTLEPKQLSGGERAIFNLALRCAIYRLLSYG
ncbi:MAG: hypothetical protein FWH46_02230, partial [Methanimicrococcus sp.]|nr:hypothetical protein [Methanimicrococcus sp.]